MFQLSLIKQNIIVHLFNVMLRGILLADCYTSTDVPNHMLESQAQFVPLISVRVSLVIGKFPKGNEKIISCPFKDSFHGISAFFDTDKGVGSGERQQWFLAGFKLKIVAVTW